MTVSPAIRSLVGGSDAALDQFATAALLTSKPQTLEELAAFVLFVADNQTGRFFNGSTLIVDGGFGVK